MRTLRSWLFVPGDRPERFIKAAASGADAIVCDLEDAVAPDVKPQARANVARWLSERTAYVRVNATGTAWHADDLAELAGEPGLLGVMLPKSELAADVAAVAAVLPERAALIALVESAAGVQAVAEIAAVAGVSQLAFGSIDLTLDAGMRETDAALLYSRSRLVIASRAAGIEAPLDGVTTSLEDMSPLAAAACRARELGFGGKLCIHPRQVQHVNAAFRPSDGELAWAREVVGASASGAAARVRGQMIDAPVLARARRLLQEDRS